MRKYGKIIKGQKDKKFDIGRATSKAAEKKN